MNIAAAFGSPRRSMARRSFWISERMASGCSSRVAIARHLQHAEHLHRLGIEVAARHRQQLALGQHEAAFEQRLVGFRRDGRRPERLAQDGGLQDAGQPGDLARRQEVVAHETFDAVLAAVAGIAHAGADDGLEVEGQALLGAAGDVVQVEPHGPEEFPGAAAMLGLGRRQHFADIRELTHGLRVVDVARDPVERLQIAQPAAAFLDVRLDDERAVAVAAMAHGTLGLLGGDVFGDAGVLAGGAETRVEIREQLFVAGDEARIEQRGADGGVLGAFDQAILDRARGVADLHAEVPQEVEHVLDDLQRLAGRFAGGEEQQVDVAEWRQHAAAVAAGAGDRQMLRLAQAGVA